MNGWRRAKLVEIAASKRWALNGGPFGSKLTTKHYSESGVPVIRGTNLSGETRFSFEDFVWVSEEKADELLPNNAHPGDLVFTQRGTIGQIGLIPLDSPFSRFVISQSQMKLSPDSAKVDALFLYYHFASPETVTTIQNLAFAAGVPHINLDILRNFEVPLPPLHIQRRIAGILSAYDDLIENCQRRIAILEAMARALYREWFVAFRFPGHEAHPRVSSPLGDIPDGWEVKRLDAFCRAIQDGDWIETKDQGGEDFRLIQISNVGVGEFVETGNFRFVTKETFSRLRCTEIEPGDLLVARMPTPIGRGWLVNKMPWRMITAVDVAIIKTEPSVVHPLFLVHTWNEPTNLNRIAAQASGTTRLRITRRELAAMEFLVPPIRVQGQFAAIIEPQAAMVEALRQKIENLRRTRDLLLPRLLSGQVDVSQGLSEVDLVPPPIEPSATRLVSAPKPLLEVAPDPLTPQTRSAATPAKGDLEPEGALTTIRQLFGDGMARNHDTALRDLAQALGFQRLGKHIKAAMSEALSSAVSQGILREVDGHYTLASLALEEPTA